MENRKDDLPPIVGKVVGVILILGLLFMIYDHFNVKHKFENDSVKKAIAVGVIMDLNPGASNAPNFEYEFEVNGKKYEGRYLIVTKLGQKSSKELRQYIGKKYKVCYVVEDTTYNKLLLDKPVEENTN